MNKSDSTAKSVEPIKVLVVDDDASIAEMLKRLLKSIGIAKVITALDGENAIKLFKNEEPDLVISDFIMPKKDGVILQIEMKELRPDIPIVLFTGYHDQLTDRLDKENLKPDYLLKKYALKVESLIKIFKECFPGHDFKTK